jgi:hypothetical protein
MSKLRTWVDDCPSGILEDCFLENNNNPILTQTDAAFQNYDKMLNQKSLETYRNFNRNINRNINGNINGNYNRNRIIRLIFLFMLIYFFLILA